MPSEPWDLESQRDAEWAAPMEREMTNTIASELSEMFPQVRVDRVTCMSSQCRVALAVPEDMYEKVNAFRALTIPLGPRVSPTFEEGMMRFDVDLSEVGDAGDWRKWHDEIRVAWREQIDRVVAAERAGEQWYE